MIHNNRIIILSLYLLIMNLTLFIAMGLDKSKARKGAWRIRENTLFSLCAAGGSIGGILGMLVFRHKTKQATFVYGFPIILLLQIILVACLIVMTGK
ncbi:MAG: DUF1294 domain-containing protein [Oscillospiraceae bacterium]|nr:DUF1294 domain-containing protein [Oscillospiraceae bacterium]